MNNARSSFDMVVLADDIIAFGGYGYEDSYEMINWRKGDKWEVTHMNQRFLFPCVTHWNEEGILITGGFKSRRTLVSNANFNAFKLITNLNFTSVLKIKVKHEILLFLKLSNAKKETWILNVKTKTTTQGPRLNTSRSFHGCEKLNDGSIIVVGGYANLNLPPLASTEMLKNEEQEWKNSPNVKQKVGSNKLVKGEGNKYVVYSLGGKTGSSKFSSKVYGLYSEKNEWKLSSNLNVPRAFGSALNVPLDIIPWCYE